MRWLALTCRPVRVENTQVALHAIHILLQVNVNHLARVPLKLVSRTPDIDLGNLLDALLRSNSTWVARRKARTQDGTLHCDKSQSTLDLTPSRRSLDRIRRSRRVGSRVSHSQMVNT